MAFNQLFKLRLYKKQGKESKIGHLSKKYTDYSSASRFAHFIAWSMNKIKHIQLQIQYY